MPPRFACQAFVTDEQLTCDCDLGPDDTTALIDAASDMLYQASGGLVTGRCTQTIRPDRDACSCGSLALDGCGCYRTDTIPLLGPDPVVTQVRIDGVVLDPASYGILDGTQLIRLAVGDQPRDWPGAQRMWRPTTEEGTFSITYTHGLHIDLVTRMAANELVCSLAKELKGASRLDGRTTGATLDGVTLTIDPTQDDEDGLTWVGRFLRMYAPQAAAAVWSVELDQGWSMHRIT